MLFPVIKILIPHSTDQLAELSKFGYFKMSFFIVITAFTHHLS